MRGGSTGVTPCARPPPVPGFDTTHPPWSSHVPLMLTRPGPRMCRSCSPALVLACAAHAHPPWPSHVPLMLTRPGPPMCRSCSPALSPTEPLSDRCHPSPPRVRSRGTAWSRAVGPGGGHGEGRTCTLTTSRSSRRGPSLPTHLARMVVPAAGRSPWSARHGVYATAARVPCPLESRGARAGDCTEAAGSLPRLCNGRPPPALLPARASSVVRCPPGAAEAGDACACGIDTRGACACALHLPLTAGDATRTAAVAPHTCDVTAQAPPACPLERSPLLGERGPLAQALVARARLASVGGVLVRPPSSNASIN